MSTYVYICREPIKCTKSIDVNSVYAVCFLFLSAVDSPEHCYHFMCGLHQGLPHNQDTEAEPRGQRELCPEVVWCQHPSGLSPGSVHLLPYCAGIKQFSPL